MSSSIREDDAAPAAVSGGAATQAGREPGRAGAMPLWVFALAAIFGALSLWSLWEQDIWWQIRAGEHILDTGTMIVEDEWSYTVTGVEWKNVQWLSTIPIAIVYRLFDVPGLIALRGVTASLVFLGLARTAFRTRIPGPPGPWDRSACALVPALAMPAIAFRVQIRSELFVIAALAWTASMIAGAPPAPPSPPPPPAPDGVKLAWTLLAGSTPPAPPPAPRAPPRRRPALLALFDGASPPAPLLRTALPAAAAIAIVANLHFGLVPFAVALAGSWCLGDSGLTNGFHRLMVAAAMPLAAALSPHPVYGLRFIWHHVFYFHDKLLYNPDHQRMTWGDLRHAPQTPILAALAVAALFTTRRSDSPRGYACLPIVFASLAAWSLGCADRTRVLPFAIIYATPLATAAAVRLARAIQTLGLEDPSAPSAPAPPPRKPPRHARSLLATLRSLVRIPSAHLAALFATAPLPWAGIVEAVSSYVAVTEHLPKGLVIAPRVWPVETVRFLQRYRGSVRPHIYHTNDFGGYLVYHLQDYQVWADTRETIFKGLEGWYLGAYKSPDVFKDLVEEFDVNVVLTKISGTQFLGYPGRGFRDVHSEYMDEDKWALVAWDDFSVLFLRRHIPSHAPIVKRHEFKVLRPNLPHTHYPVFQTPSKERDAEMREDLRKCKEYMPGDGFCLAARSAWSRRVGDDPGYTLQGALTQLKALPSKCLAAQMEIRMIEVCMGQGMRTKCALDEQPAVLEWTINAVLQGTRQKANGR